MNTIGMGVALACCIVAYLNWKYNNDYDIQHVNAESIYRVNFIRITNGSPIKNGASPAPLGNVVRETIPEVDNVVRIHPTGGNIRVGDDLFNIGVGAVEPDFFKVFTVPLIEGTPEQLEDRSTIYLSDRAAEKYFPDGDALGATVTYMNGDRELEFKVGGVYERFPQNSMFQMDALTNYYLIKSVDFDPDNDWDSFTQTFLKIDDPNQITNISENLQQYVAVQNQVKPDYKVEEYYLESFVGMAQRAENDDDLWNHWFYSALPAPAVIAPVIMSILVLLIACFNFTNTSIAIANRRLKEIGIRKVMGSRRGQLIAQFLGENILLCFMALLVALGLSYFLVPAYSSLWEFLDLSHNFLENQTFYLFLVGLLLATGLVAGSYPAFYISGIQPTNILRGTIRYGGTSGIMRVLLTLQFSISMIAIVSGFIFSQNARYQQEYDMGFNKSGLLFAYVGSEAEYNGYVNELSGHPKIKAISGSSHNVATSWYTDPVKFDNEEIDIQILNVSETYLETIGARILAGRNFEANSENDRLGSIIVNEEMVRTFGWEEPVGQKVQYLDSVSLYVVGVVKNIYLDALWSPVRPMMLRYTKPEGYRWITVKTDPSNSREVHDFMESKWKNVFPNRLPNVSFIEDIDVSENETINSNIRLMFIFLGVVALLLSASGLFTMVTLNIIRRMKEIGVRKVLGASIGNIAYLVNKQFIVILLISAVLGSVGAYFLNDLLMSSIWTYYLEIGPSGFIGSIALLFIASAAAVGHKIFIAANANPANTLRDE